jgi:hypothetical protein
MATSEPSPQVKRRISQDIAVREATKAAQAALGVTADGVFGADSLRAVLALVARCKLLESSQAGLIEKQ